MLKKIDKVQLMYIWIIIQPIIDIIVSFTVRESDSSFTIGVILRGLFLVIMVLMSFFNKQVKERKKLYLFYGILVTYFIGYMAIRIIDNGLTISLLINEVKYIFKYFYYPILLISLYSLRDYFKLDNVKMKNILVLNLFIITSSILFSELTNTSFNSYSGSNSGIVGWFYSANEIGAIIILLYPYTFLMNREKQVLPFTIVMIFTILTSMYMGTKTTYLGIILTLVFYVLYLIIFRVKDEVRTKYKITYLGISALLIFSMAFDSAAVSNMENTHNNYQENDNVIVDKVIFSSRLDFLKIDYDIYSQKGIDGKLFGIGFTGDKKGEGEYVYDKRSEMDFCDIFLRYGILGFIIYISPLVIMFVKMLKIIFAEKFKNINTILPLYSILIGLAISFLAGHVISAPAVSIYIVFSSFIVLNQKKKIGVKK